MRPNSRDISIPVDLIRSIAVIFVILLHASIEPTPTIDIMSPQGVELWWTVDIYDSLAKTAVPLFVMLTGALLLQPSKVDEPIRVFFKKRWKRIGLPFVFWGTLYFLWRFLVNGEVLTVNSVFQGVLNGPYYHFWFLYLLIGLYLLTPLLRVIVKSARLRVLRYFLLLWFIGTAIPPLITLFQPYGLSTNVFMITGWLGYFVLGAYLLRVHLKRIILLSLFLFGLVWTAIGTYFLVGTLGERLSQFFLDYYSFSIITSSAALFLLFLTIHTHTQTESRLPNVNHALKVISENTLPIYLFHVMVLEALQKGYFGLKISVTTMTPLIEIPLLTIVTLSICLAVIVPLKKIPYVKRIIG